MGWRQFMKSHYGKVEFVSLSPSYGRKDMRILGIQKKNSMAH